MELLQVIIVACKLATCETLTADVTAQNATFCLLQAAPVVAERMEDKPDYEIKDVRCAPRSLASR